MSKKNKLISIIIPVYNAEEFLSRCLDSILLQSYKAIEIIIIDDGSSDNSFKICSEYSKIDKRIIVISKINEGVSKARNCGLEIAKGEFITFIDADDCFLDCKTLENNINILCKNSYISFVEFPHITFNNKRSLLPKVKYQKISNKKDFFYSIFISHDLTGYTWGKLFRKDFINNIRFDRNFKYAEDTFFLLECMENFKGAIKNIKGLYGYYQRENSAARTFDKKACYNFHRLHYNAFIKSTEFRFRKNIQNKLWFKAYFTYADSYAINGKSKDHYNIIDNLKKRKIYRSDNLEIKEKKWYKIIKCLGLNYSFRLYKYSFNLNLFKQFYFNKK